MKSSRASPRLPKTKKKRNPVPTTAQEDLALVCDAVGLKDENDTGKQEDLLS